MSYLFIFCCFIWCFICLEIELFMLFCWKYLFLVELFVLFRTFCWEFCDYTRRRRVHYKSSPLLRNNYIMHSRWRQVYFIGPLYIMTQLIYILTLICLISNTSKHHLPARVTLVLYLWCYSYIMHRCTCPLKCAIQPLENTTNC